MGRLFKKIFSFNNDNTDNGIKQFCKAEFGSDWYYAYLTYKQDGKFPYMVRVRV